MKVTRFDAQSMTVDVQPVSKRLDANGTWQTQPPTLGIPVAPTRCGDWILRPWYKVGDIGVVLYLDHDMDKALASGGECQPNTERSHSQSDAVFIGGVVPGTMQTGSIPEGLALAKVDGSIYVVIKEDIIEILGDCQWQGDIDIKGHVRITGELTVNGIDFTPHTHSGVEPGDGVSGRPQ
ncbi:MAG: hypothetical protein HFG27_08595 [Provencibacterium sp.]|nr:hypothetical protein [Provencibacterium sp.]